MTEIIEKYNKIIYYSHILPSKHFKNYNYGRKIICKRKQN